MGSIKQATLTMVDIYFNQYKDDRKESDRVLFQQQEHKN